jgi:hypothetical protein
MPIPAKSSTAGRAGVVLSGTRNSLGADAGGRAGEPDDRADEPDGRAGEPDDRADEPDGRGEEARRFGWWGLRDMRLSAFLETARTGVRTMTVRTPVSGYAPGGRAGTVFSA